LLSCVLTLWRSASYCWPAALIWFTSVCAPLIAV
jgi:hypothetical protein